MARSSARKGHPSIKKITTSPSEGLNVWRQGASRLAEQGRMLWLLGEALTAALEAQAQGGPPPDEDVLVAQLTKWVRDLHPGQLRFTSEGCPAEQPIRGGRKPAGGPKYPRPVLTYDGRSLADIHCPVLWVGSREIGPGLWGTMALGVGTDGFRRVLGLNDGSVRERSVSEQIVGDLVARGLDVKEGVVVVTEGSRALDRALVVAWKGRVHVAHCRVRLRQDLLRHVSPSSQEAVQSQLDGAWSLPPEPASALLLDLEQKLATDFPGAAERLGRSREASLVAARLGVPSPLRERLQSAGTLRMAFKKSLRWSPPDAGNQALAVGVPAWLQRTRRLVGWRALELLALKLPTFRTGPENNAAPQS